MPGPAKLPQMQLASMKGSLEDQFLDHSPQKLERPNPSRGQGRSLTESSTGWKIRLEATIIKDMTGRESATTGNPNIQLGRSRDEPVARSSTELKGRIDGSSAVTPPLPLNPSCKRLSA